MGEKDYLWFLDGSPLDRYRHYVPVTRGRVTVFRVQYEAYIEGQWHAIVRYDTAHGFPHRDMRCTQRFIQMAQKTRPTFLAQIAPTR